MLKRVMQAMTEEAVATQQISSSSASPAAPARKTAAASQWRSPLDACWMDLQSQRKDSPGSHGSSGDAHRQQEAETGPRMGSRIPFQAEFDWDAALRECLQAQAQLGLAEQAGSNTKEGKPGEISENPERPAHSQTEAPSSAAEGPDHVTATAVTVTGSEVAAHQEDSPSRCDSSSPLCIGQRSSSKCEGGGGERGVHPGQLLRAALQHPWHHLKHAGSHTPSKGTASAPPSGGSSPRPPDSKEKGPSPTPRAKKNRLLTSKSWWKPGVMYHKKAEDGKDGWKVFASLMTGYEWND